MCLTIGLTVVGVQLFTPSAGALELTPHTFMGPAWSARSWAVTTERATISVPSSPPAGAVTAWLMAESLSPMRYTQVGFMWQPNFKAEPFIFAYSAHGNNEGDGFWSFGPQVQPGSTITVQLVRNGQLWIDEAWIGHKWDALAEYAVPGTPVAYEEAYGPAEQVCFTDALDLIPSVGWEPLPTTCEG